MPQFVCGGKVKAHQDPTFEMAYNAYANRGNMTMPNTLNYLTEVTRKQRDPVDRHMMIYETLTHGGWPTKVQAAQ